MATTAKRSKQKTSQVKRSIEDDVIDVDITEIKTSPENDKLYKPVTARDPAIQELACSVRDEGLLDPILLSMDNYILSGHRRFMACRMNKLKKVRCRRANVWHDGNPEQFTKLLREHNRQRVKSLDEQVREAIVDANPDEARSEIIEYRRLKSKVSHDPLLIENVKYRKEISEAKRAFQDAIIAVVNARKDHWPMSDRQVHYGLLNDPPLKHSGKPDSRYQNDIRSYKSLVELITRMRLVGAIPFAAIADETRPFIEWNVHAESGAFVTKELDGFLKGYNRNLIQSQPNHIEVVVEKNTVAGIVKPVCGEFCIPQTSGRGYCSLAPRADMARRFRFSGKEKLIVLFVTDFDGDGECIAESFARSMRDDFGVESLHPIKIALNADQVREYDLPPSMLAKESSSRTKAFVEKYGGHVWELEALTPEDLQEIVRAAIVDVLDMDLFEAEQEAEANDIVQLKAIRVTAQAALSNVSFETEGDE